MTREEAIAILEVSKHMATSGRMYNQAIDMAIEALSAPSGDLISRADAIEELKGAFYFNTEDCRTAINCINALPSAEQVTSKLNNSCNSLLTDESNGSKEHKSKLDLISRQDVIEALCRSSVYAWSIEQDQTAHDWALNIINALPSADVNQNNGRLINADALMDLLKERKQFFVDSYGGFHRMSEKDKARCDEIDACIASIVNAPTVSADAEQGVWEHIESTWEDNIFKCSKCGNPLKIPTVDGEPIYNYCLHCGAKMGNAWGERND